MFRDTIRFFEAVARGQKSGKINIRMYIRIEARNTVHRAYARWESLLLLPFVQDNGNSGDVVRPVKGEKDIYIYPFKRVKIRPAPASAM